MNPAIARLGSSPFLRFLLCGGFAAGVNWSSRFLWSQLLPFGWAVIAAYCTGMVVAFLLFRALVFPESQTPIRIQTANFVLVNLVGMASTYLVARLLVEWLFPMIGMTFHPEPIGHGFAILVPVATSWIGHKHLTFR